MIREVLDFLKMNDVEYKDKTKLSAISPARIGGIAEIIAYPKDTDSFVELLFFLKNNKIKYKIVGRMSNILFSDSGFDGVVIRTDKLCQYRIASEELWVECGAALPRMAGILCLSGFSGFEGISGIPGSIGGAIVGNAGAFGVEISDFLKDVSYVDLTDGSCRTLSRKDIIFSYRSSPFKASNFAILSASFRLTEKDPSSIRSEMEKFRLIRKNTQPYGRPTLGSVFKRPRADLSAARLIDECGLKGYFIGGAQISPKHAGFIVNEARATALDFLSLADYAEQCVYNKFGICLEKEIEVL